MTDKRNAFDLLRLLLAACVLIGHAILIGGYELQDPLALFSKGQTNLPEFGVMGFFALSGYLITASFERCKSLVTFASHRLLRILPAFWVCLLVTGFILAPLIYVLEGNPVSNFQFTGPGSATGYVVKNSLLKIRQWGIKDVLDHARYQASLDGSLWSLYPEMQCYCLTLVAGISGLFNKNKVLYMLFAATIFVFFAINFNFSKNFGPTFLILSPAFKLYVSYLAGTLIYMFPKWLIFDRKGTVFLVVFTLMLVRFGGYNMISPVLVAMTLVNVFGLFKFTLRYDVSYGVYIYSFPVQQLLFQLFGNHLSVLFFILFSFSVAIPMGFLSYIFVERPFINFKNKANLKLQ
ncbi:acyltransferase family protein [Mucilaginibacter flavidus]|uniref:acyltransferase family protein n=1 Tax=Mucilaginibacter flavidus TaxID=2949309 RepID=UPI002093CFE9|nr:acyltransferase [Mucilaginibacter flavidus]MCO5947677.1 acyltransferase [Mucilaginibacter flavidus]